jgi:hypothetical protein
MANLNFVIRHNDIASKFVGREFLSQGLTFVSFCFASCYSTREEAEAILKAHNFNATVVDLESVK